MRGAPTQVLDDRMFPSFHFRLGGIPVEVQAWALISAAFAVRSRSDPLAQCVWIGVALVSVLWHELGHALAMRARGFRGTILLHALGGLARWPRDAYPSIRERMFVTLSGPGAGLVLGGLLWVVSSTIRVELPGLAGVALGDAIWINLGWSLLNLVPILPLDGGHLLDEIAEMITGVHEARWVGMVSMIIGGYGAYWAASHRWAFASFFALYGAIMGWVRWSGARLGAQVSMQ